MYALNKYNLFIHCLYCWVLITGWSVLVLPCSVGMPAHSVSHSQNFHEAVGGSNANEPASYPLRLGAAEIINIHQKEVEINQDYFQLNVFKRGIDQEKEWL